MAEEIAFKVFLLLALVAILITRAEPVLAILVKGDKNIFVKLYCNQVTGWGGDSVLFFFYF